MFNKKIVLGVVALGLSTVAISSFAANQGVYVSGQAGYGSVHQSTYKPLGYTNKDTISHLAGRLAAGYQFNQYVATELGWSRYGTVSQKGYFISSAISNYDTSLTTNVVDLAVKGILPIADKVSVFGKVGGAYVIESVSAHVTTLGIKQNADKSKKKLLPEAGIGVSYAFTDNVAADISYNHIQSTGNSKTRMINNLDFVGVGLTYSF